MALAFQFNVTGNLDGSTPLSSEATKTPDDEGILVVELPAGADFGRFNPGDLVTQRSAHYFLQSAQVTSSGGTTKSELRMLGRAPGGGRVVTINLDLTAERPNGYYDGGFVVPAGYELSFESNGTPPFLVRVTMWALEDSADVGTCAVAEPRRLRGGDD